MSLTAEQNDPLLLELDDATWSGYLERCEDWFRNVQLIQHSFWKLAEETRGKVNEPHIRQFLEEVASTARRHDEQAAALFKAIGREPSGVGVLGTLVEKARKAAGDLVGIATGAAPGWRDMHQLFLASLNSISAWSAAEQLGYALGLNTIADIAYPVTNEKTTQHLILQELLLEMSATAILHGSRP